MSPQDLIILAKKSGLQGLCITDHDCVDAYEAAIPIAKKENILLGSGVEFSSSDLGTSVHILGYDFDLQNSDLKAFCKKHIERRRFRNQNILEKLAKHQMPLNVEELESESLRGRPVGRPHIAEAMRQRGYVKTLQEAFDRFIGDGKPCFDPGISMTCDETIDIIHNAGGKAFIAHPHVIHERGKVEQLLQKPFDGIECYYSKTSKEGKKRWLSLAKAHRLLVSGGSDFHGDVKPSIPLGCSWVDRTQFDLIFQRLLT